MQMAFCHISERRKFLIAGYPYEGPGPVSEAFCELLVTIGDRTTGHLTNSVLSKYMCPHGHIYSTKFIQIHTT